MKKIIFDKDGIEEIRKYLESGHTKRETCNRFTIKLDTLNKVIRENNIKQGFPDKLPVEKVSEEQKQLICTLFKTTSMPLRGIREEVGIRCRTVLDVIEENFSQYEIDQRKHLLYQNSKLGDKNPMFGKCGEEHHNYIGVISDGKGYLIVLKPEWYTGRKNSKHVFLHSVVMCEHLGITEIPKGFCVHHIDGNPKNNDISNLCLLTVEAHSKLHQIQRKMCKSVEASQINDVGKPKC